MKAGLWTKRAHHLYRGQVPVVPGWSFARGVLFARVLCLLAILLGMGCAHLGRDGGEVVRSVDFDGNGNFLQGTSDFHLRRAMEQAKSSWTSFAFFWVDPVALDRQALLRDAWRIEVWYAHHGYYEARFLGWDIQTRRMPGRLKKNGRQRPAVVRLVGRVEQGPPSIVRDVSYEGVDALGVGTALESILRRSAEIAPGDRFDLDDVKATEEIISSIMRERSYAHTSVQTAIEVFPEEHAVDIRFVVHTGPPCRFGEIRVSGNKAVPEDLIRQEITIVPGTSFKASTLGATRQRLFSLGTFSQVNVIPDLQSGGPEDAAVLPVDVRLVEARFQQLKAGVGFGIESGYQDVHLSTTYHHANLAHRLLQLDLSGEVGQAAVLAYTDLVTGEAVFDPTTLVNLKQQITWPRIFGRRWRLVETLTYEQGLESNYHFTSPTFNPSLSYSATPKLTFTFGYRFQYFKYLDLDPSLDISQVQESRLGLDLTNPYFLSVVEQKTVWDARDDVLSPRRGEYATVSLGMAGSPVGQVGQFNYLKSSGDFRIYRSWNDYRPLLHIFRMKESFVLAGRFAAGIAQPYGPKGLSSVPYSERFFLGGGSTVRGWATDHLGPFICEQAVGDTTKIQPMTDPSSCLNTTESPPAPIGGLAESFASIELRKSLRWGVGVVGFLDAGMAWDTPESIKTVRPKAAAGGGVRYASPVGPVRLDLGFRLDHDSYYALESRWNAHFSLSEAF